jgi:glycosyltransferase involved in cell wall biosynthesis
MGKSVGNGNHNLSSGAVGDSSKPEMQLPISVVVPAYNEEDGIAPQLEAIRNVLECNHVAHEIIVVDDGSGDATAAQAAPFCDAVIQQPENRGYGAALKTGIKAAKNDTIVIIDADGTYPADAIPGLLEHAQEYDMVVGARTGKHVRIPLLRRPAKWFLRVLAGYLAGRSIPDLNSGLRVMKKPVIEEFYHLLPSGFSFTTSITLALMCNDRFIYYHPIDYFQRVGKSKIRPVDAYHFWLLILRTIIYFNPLKVFIPFGAILFLAGTVKFIYDLFIGNLSESAIMGFLGASIIWAVGLLADQAARIGSATRKP